MPKTIAIIVAAGKGVRAGGDIPKQYVEIAGKTVLARSVAAFARHPLITDVLVVIPQGDEGPYDKSLAGLGSNSTRQKEMLAKLLPPVAGGKTRQESVCNALKALAKHQADLVLVHDAARPFVEEGLISAIISELSRSPAVLPVVAVTDTLKQVQDGQNGTVVRTLDRSKIFAAQTPQGFKFPLLLDLHKRAEQDDGSFFTDDASLAERAGISVKTVEGDISNIKLTSSRDMAMAELLLRPLHNKDRSRQKDMQTTDTGKMEIRTGTGFDVHRFAKGDGVTLCAVKIPFDRKLLGHSDADVALHALADAIYGALGAGDIGRHFPPGDDRWAGASSNVFVQHAVGLVAQRGGKINNIDITIICEQPKISPYHARMCEKLASMTALPVQRISVKATTTEGLGFTGRREGVAAQAIATIAIPPGVDDKDEADHV